MLASAESPINDSESLDDSISLEVA